MSLVAEGGTSHSEGYIYFAGFSVFVEALNLPAQAPEPIECAHLYQLPEARGAVGGSSAAMGR